MEGPAAAAAGGPPPGRTSGWYGFASAGRSRALRPAAMRSSVRCSGPEKENIESRSRPRSDDASMESARADARGSAVRASDARATRGNMAQARRAMTRRRVGDGAERAAGRRRLSELWDSRRGR